VSAPLPLCTTGHPAARRGPSRAPRPRTGAGRSPKLGWRVAQPDAPGRFRRQPPVTVAATAGARMGMRVALPSRAENLLERERMGVLPEHEDVPLLPGSALNRAARRLDKSRSSRRAHERPIGVRY